MWKFVNALFLLILHSHRCSSSAIIVFEDHKLYEGYRCNLTNGYGMGSCTKAVDCPQKVLEIMYQKLDGVGHCGYSKFDEIVCCPNLYTKPSPAKVACDLFKGFTKPAGNDDGSKFRGKKVADSKLDAPFVAALGYLDNNEVKYYCGGTLIAEDYVLTAAHCVSNLQNLIPIEVMVGTTDLGDRNPSWVQRINVSKIITHPKYVTGKPSHDDIAILRLTEPVKFTHRVLPACLNTEPLESLNSQELYFKIFGWEATKVASDTSNSLMAADFIRQVDSAECTKNYEIIDYYNFRRSNVIDDRTICAQDSKRRNGKICQRDSGGPLLVQNTEFPLLAGVKSFGSVCGSDQPAGYTSVWKYSYWIEDQVWGH